MSGRTVLDTGNLGKHGCCSLAVQNERLVIVFPRALFDGKQKLLYLGLADSKKNRGIAMVRIQAIQNDISLGQFDHTLERYKHQVKKQAYLTESSEIVNKITLLELWGKYFEYKKSTLKERTIKYYKEVIECNIKKSGIESPYQSLELRNCLMSYTTQSVAKRVLMYVSACFDWGLKHQLVKGSNPYKGMANELRHNYQDNAKPNAFTIEQKQTILDTFASHKNYNYYLNFVKFLFLTGCRPNEAISLKWVQVLGDCQKIRFYGKTKRVREFPCNQELRELIKKVKKDFEDDLVFLSPTGQAINYDNFSRRAWSVIVDPIKPGTTPYCCRDTFITEQILKGVNPAIVGKWCDNSTQTIEKHYLDLVNINHVLPK